MISLRTSSHIFRYPQILRRSLRYHWICLDVLNILRMSSMISSIIAKVQELFMIFVRTSLNSFEYHQLYIQDVVKDVRTCHKVLFNVIDFLKHNRVVRQILRISLRTFRISLRKLVRRIYIFKYLRIAMISLRKSLNILKYP